LIVPTAFTGDTNVPESAIEQLNRRVERRGTQVHVALRHAELAVAGEFLHGARRAARFIRYCTCCRDSGSPYPAAYELSARQCRIALPR